jgi:SAM-dependent methyltransferase
MNPYETEKYLSEYLLFHYGRAEDILPENAPAGMAESLDFAVRTTRHFSQGRVQRTLDLGCAVGRSSYELSRRSEMTLGIDFSENFIAAAQKIAAAPLRCQRLEESGHFHDVTVALPEGHFGVLAFEQGDAMNLRKDLGSFDRVHAANLICRLPEPLKLLQRFADLVKLGGELVLATPCTWLEEYTPPENWPQPDTFEWLKAVLSPAFELKSKANEPFLIRETARKFQWTSAMVTRWERK